MGGGGSGPRGSNAGQKSLSSHLWPSEPCAPQRGAQRGCHRWFYTCSCLAFSTLVVSVFVTQHYTVTSTSGSLTARPRFQLTSCEHIRTLDFPERIRLFFSALRRLSSFFFFFCCRRLLVEGQKHSFSIVLIVTMNRTEGSANVLIRVQDLKLNLCWASSFSFSSSALTSIVDFNIFHQTLAKSSGHVDLLKIRADFTRNFRQPHWKMTHSVCAGAVSSPACLPFNTRGLFLVNLHNSRTWASMGAAVSPGANSALLQLNSERRGDTTQTRSQEHRVQGRQMCVKSVCLWNLTACSQVHIGASNLSSVCASCSG